MVVVVSFWLAPGSRHMSNLIRNSRKQTTGYIKQSFNLRTSPNCSREHSLQEINGPENTHPFETRGRFSLRERRHSEINPSRPEQDGRDN